jgi:GNAT superfamily N-acetyltransferase
MNSQPATGAPQLDDVSVHPLTESNLADADRIFRLAFGTFIGLPDPTAFAGDADYVRTRWRADPSAAFAAHLDGQIVGSNFASRWGSVGFFGPLTIRPDLWDKGIGKRLMQPIMSCFEKWGARHTGLFTFPHSQKHIGLYQRFGFWPRFLTPVMSKPVAPTKSDRSPWTKTKLSNAPDQDRKRALAVCREITNAIYDGLDVSSEIRSVAEQRLGDTVLLWRDAELSGLAVCHVGAGTEAGSGTCYVKFGAVRPGKTAAEDFDRLLTACEEFAAESGVSRLGAGVNTARHEAYARLIDRGFRTDMEGLAMQRPNEPGYNRPGVYVLDDWR